MRFTRREGCYVVKEIRRPAHLSQARAVPTERIVGNPEVGRKRGSGDRGSSKPLAAPCFPRTRLLGSDPNCMAGWWGISQHLFYRSFASVRHKADSTWEWWHS